MHSREREGTDLRHDDAGPMSGWYLSPLPDGEVASDVTGVKSGIVGRADPASSGRQAVVKHSVTVALR